MSNTNVSLQHRKAIPAEDLGNQTHRFIEIYSIRKSSYTRALLTTVLQGINLSIAAGEFLSIMGPSGSGKTTLMNILYGLIRRDSGEILVNGRPTRITGPRDAIARPPSRAPA